MKDLKELSSRKLLEALLRAFAKAKRPDYLAVDYINEVFKARAEAQEHWIEAIRRLEVYDQHVKSTTEAKEVRSEDLDKQYFQGQHGICEEDTTPKIDEKYCCVECNNISLEKVFIPIGEIHKVGWCRSCNKYRGAKEIDSIRLVEE